MENIAPRGLFNAATDKLCSFAEQHKVNRLSETVVGARKTGVRLFDDGAPAFF